MSIKTSKYSCRLLTFDWNVVRQQHRQRDGRLSLPQSKDASGGVVCSLCTGAKQLCWSIVEVGAVIEARTAQQTLIFHYRAHKMSHFHSQRICSFQLHSYHKNCIFFSKYLRYSQPSLFFLCFFCVCFCVLLFFNPSIYQQISSGRCQCIRAARAFLSCSVFAVF